MQIRGWFGDVGAMAVSRDPGAEVPGAALTMRRPLRDRREPPSPQGPAAPPSWRGTGDHRGDQGPLWRLGTTVGSRLLRSAFGLPAKGVESRQEENDCKSFPGFYAYEKLLFQSLPPLKMLPLCLSAAVKRCGSEEEA